MKFDSPIFEEYKTLKNKLLNDQEILALIKKRNELNNELRDVDQYTSKYKTLFAEYNEVSSKLLSNETYYEFKTLEREINLFVMYCNKELESLFELNEKGCHQ